MTTDEIHRVLNLTGILALMFCWTLSIVTHRRAFSRRQVAVSVALLPFFAVVGHGTYRAWQNGLPVTVDTWSISVAVAIVLTTMAAPHKWFHDRKRD
jgi:MFS-type transporter involved in bile tolerance (Atg22 family)